MRQSTLQSVSILSGQRWRGGAPRPQAVAWWVLVAPLTAVGLMARPEYSRAVLAALLVVAAVALAGRWPRAAVTVGLVSLPFLGFFRRLLIGFAGWSETDPLLLVAPSLVAFLLVKLFLLERRPIAPDRYSKLVLALFALSLLQVANPNGGGLAAGLAGLLFVGVPFLWFFIGRELADARLVLILSRLLVAVGVITIAYGLGQANLGFPSWDVRWAQIVGEDYRALDIGEGTLRSFSTFASAQEYSLFAGITAIIGFALAFGGSKLWLLVIPAAVTAVFLAASRSPVVYIVLALIVLIALQRRSRAGVALVIVVGVVTAGSLFLLLGDRLAGSESSDNVAVSRQVEGLRNPFDPDKSTLGLHIELVAGGIRSGFTNPLGLGTGAGTRAGTLSEDFVAADTEIDVSNAFQSFGLLGGVLFVAIFLTAWSRIVRRYLSARETAALVTAGVMVVMLGQWLNGGLYAASALLWFLLGWSVQPTEAERNSTSRPDPPPGVERTPVIRGRPRPVARATSL